MGFCRICERCGTTLAGDAARCTRCGGLATFRYDAGAAALPPGVGHLWDYRAFLPITDEDDVVSLGEGGTPLLRAREADWDCRLYWKNEALNPTGSQKDRALSVALSEARAVGAARVVIASTGSAGLACAAYSARAGIPCLILVPQGLPRERMAPMHAYGAVVAEVAGSFETIEAITARLGPEWYQASTIRSVNPAQAEGAKTIAYEIVGALGGAPDWVVVPVGGGATLHGIWRGFRSLLELGRIERMPRLVGAQARAFNTLQRTLELGLGEAGPFDCIAADSTAATTAINLKHSIPPDLPSALAAIRGSDGLAVSAEEDEILYWQRRLGREGVFCEPSSAVAAAAVATLTRGGRIQPGACVVAVITGSGLRDPARSSVGPVPRLSSECCSEDLIRLLNG